MNSEYKRRKNNDLRVLKVYLNSNLGMCQLDNIWLFVFERSWLPLPKDFVNQNFDSMNYSLNWIYHAASDRVYTEIDSNWYGT